MATQEPPLLVIPRPGTIIPKNALPSPIQAPTEADMIKNFGDLLPKASYLTTPHGKAAYYVYSPTMSTSMSPPPLTILMIHGIQTPALGLQPLATALRTRYPAAHIALVDLWGHGLTDTPFAPHIPSLFYGLLDAVLAALAWQESIHLVGYSFGGSLAAGYAALHPERVETVALIAPAGLMRFSLFPEEVQRRYGLMGSAGDGDVDEEGTRDLVIEFLEGGKLTVPDDWRDRAIKGEVVAEAVRDWEMKVHPGHAGSAVAIFRDGGVFEKQATFKTVVKSLGAEKCLGIVGELDEVCSRQNLLDVGLSNVTIIPQVGHAVVRERVDEVATLIREFWG